MSERLRSVTQAHMVRLTGSNPVAVTFLYFGWRADHWAHGFHIRSATVAEPRHFHGYLTYFGLLLIILTPNK